MRPHVTRSAWPLLLPVCLLVVAVSAQAQGPRERQLFDNGWRFRLGEVEQGELPALADASWRQVDLPHDWSIEGPYSPQHASGTGFLPAGIGWYRKTFQLPERMRGRKVAIRFDGVYRNSTVWLNGALLGSRPNGYSSFEYDLTPHLRFGPAANTLAVRVARTEVADSRWYPGTGIYRHVWLEVTGPLHIAPWGTYVTTPVVAETEALVSIETLLVNETSAQVRVTVVTSILNEEGQEVASTRSEEPVAAAKERTFAQQLALTRPTLWSPDTPRLYTSLSRVYQDSQLVDEKRTQFGIRRFHFNPDSGLIFNGRALKLKGVCLHHDLGALGAAFFEEALERRLRSLKAIGVNALRTAHNPMSPEFYELADRMGFLVMNEAFDEWLGGKRKWAEGWNVGVAEGRGYHEFFEEWGIRDVQAMVLRDRNHPSIILWSIGNEIDYPGDPFVHPRGRAATDRPGPSANLMAPIARRLMAAVKELDPTRPVTMALADIDASNATGVADMLDVVGYNYLEQNYARDHQAYPQRVIYGSENSRNVDSWRAVAQNRFIAGQFVWTGMNYLGEAGRWPSHGSNAGLLDLQGFWKRDAYLRQALWSDKPMVYATAWGAVADESRIADWPRTIARVPAVERWGWTANPRTTIPVEIYTNCDSVEVLLNGRSLGVKPIPDPLLPALLWPVPNQPGTVEVRGWKAGNVAARTELKTSGQPARLELIPDLTTIRSAGRQVSTIEVHVLDRDGSRIPDADLTVSFDVQGAGRLHAVGSADLTDTTSVTARQIKLYQGRAVAVVRSAAEPGPISVRATAPGVPPAEIRIEAVR
jgi:beta-galactosidase